MNMMEEQQPCKSTLEKKIIAYNSPPEQQVSFPKEEKLYGLVVRALAEDFEELGSSPGAATDSMCGLR